MENNTLTFTKKEHLKFTKIYQVDNGTIFYHEYFSSPHRLFVKLNGRDIKADMPQDEFEVMGVVGNAVYVRTQRKVYRAEYTSDHAIIIDFERDLLKDESIHCEILCSRKYYGNKYIYRISEDFRNGIIFDVLDKKLTLLGMHRKKLIYVSNQKYCPTGPKLSQLTDNAIVIELPVEHCRGSFYASDSSKMIYFTTFTRKKFAGHLFALDTEEKVFLPNLTFASDENIRMITYWMRTKLFFLRDIVLASKRKGKILVLIQQVIIRLFSSDLVPNSAMANFKYCRDGTLSLLGVFNGIITATNFICVNEFNLVSARLPKGYIQQSNSQTGNQFLQVPDGKKEIHQTNGELLEQICQLRLQVHKLTIENERLTEALKHSEENVSNAEQRVAELKSEMLEQCDDPMHKSWIRVYYQVLGYPTILYAKYKGKPVVAILPEGKIEQIDAYGEHVYFMIQNKVYIASFTPPDAFYVSFSFHQTEKQVNHLSMRSKKIDEKIYLFRMWEQPEKDGIVIDASDDHLKGLLFAGVHRKKIICIRQNELSSKKLSENVIVLEIPFVREFSGMKTHDKTPFIYLTDGISLFTFNVDTMEFLPPFRFLNPVVSILGIFNGDISFTANENNWGKCCVLTGQLPSGYFDGTAKEASEKELVSDTQIKDKINSVNLTEVEHLQIQIENLEKQLMHMKSCALTCVMRSLKFKESQKLEKPFICFQLESGTIVYFDNSKPFELFISEEGAEKADVKLLEGEYDCTFRGIEKDVAYFSTIRAKCIKFFKASVIRGNARDVAYLSNIRGKCMKFFKAVVDQQIVLAQINEMNTSELSLFKNEPFYFIERSREWCVYKYDETYTEMEGEKFDISKIDLLSKYERHYHRGVIYLFRETSSAKIEQVNEKVVVVEGPLLDYISFHTPAHSDNIYITNSSHNVILVLNTIELTVSQICYEPPAGSNNHSIVGIHDGVLTMAFDGVWGRQLHTSTL